MIVEDTTPYPWPYDRRLSPASTALVVCGAGPTWAGRVPNDPEAQARLTSLRAAAAQVGLLVVLVDHRSLDRAGNRVATIDLPPNPCPPLEAAGDEVTVGAAGTDGFYGSALDRVLHRGTRSHLLLAGYGFETTVHSTLRRANDRGYECLTVADACLTVDPTLRAASISTIEFSGGIFGAVGRTAAVIAALHTTDPTATPDPEQSETP